MKRDAYGEDGPAFKRQRHSGEETTFLIPSKVAGSIIGKGGANISKLRNQYKASITVPDCPGPERVLTITAPDVDTTLEIVKEILPNLADAGVKGRDGPSNEDLDVRMLIHQSRAGCVIGKAGSKIKELREKTGARLKIFTNTAPQSTERVVQLLGGPDSVAEAVREVIELTRQVPIKGAVANYEPHNYDDFYAEEYGGYGGGGGPGPSPPRQRHPAFGSNGPPPRAAAPRSGPPRAAFSDFAGPPPRGNFHGPPRGSFGSGGPNFGNNSGNFGGGGGNFSGGGNRPPPSGNFNSNQNNQDESSTQVTIPKDLAGAIIGKAGSRIRKIRAESGAGIEIAEPLPGANERVITITGTPTRIQMAQYLLQQSVHESHPNLARGNY